MHRIDLEPQWRFETKLPATIEVDPNESVELECSVQDEDAECEWFLAGEVGVDRATHTVFVFSFARKSSLN